MKRIDELNFLRFIAAILIVIYHFGETSFPFQTEPFIRIIRGDAYLVSFFFVLSGFIISYVYYPQALEGIDFRSFLVKRLSRFLPLYWITLAFMIFLLYERSARPLFVGLFEVPMLHAWVPTALLGFNYPDWAMSVFFAIYLFFPVTFNYLVKIDFKKVTLVVAIVWVISQLAVHLLGFWLDTDELEWAHEFLKYNPIFHLSTFLIGVWGGLKFRFEGVKDSKDSRKYTGLLVAAMVLFVGFISFRYELQDLVPITLYFSTGLLAPFYLWGIILVARDQSRISQWLRLKPLVRLGDISFSIYLLQAPVFFGYNQFLKQRMEFHFPWTQHLHFYLCVVILLALAYFSRNWFEVPVQRFLRQHLIPSKIEQNQT